MYVSIFQYLANVDETPAKMGGKENYWRKLTLDGKTLSLKNIDTYLSLCRRDWLKDAVLLLQTCSSLRITLCHMLMLI